MFHLFLLLAAGFCHSATDMQLVTVLQGSVATLPCPEEGDVTWSRYIAGEQVPLVTITNGLETQKTERFGSLADKSLVITNIIASDTATYLCNKARVYLNVTTDPKAVRPSAGNEPVTQRNDGFSQKDANRQAADFWKFPVGVLVGVLVGAALVLSVIVTVRFCSKRSDRTVTEVIYEEVRAGVEQPGGDSYFESPYYTTSISETPSASTAPSHNNMYSSVSRLTAEGTTEECVYSLAQNPLQTGSTDQ
ncbi:uncharacterized protein LOC131970517 [Centropristis striata]|uniref:uncharacterized protein LOC131970517 n=1 Tax=Centropristis striata TaxID=184440 RepID=UPI0027E08C7F|nr:uncharacterized protein LOC131970517 [Centropristis striata]